MTMVYSFGAGIALVIVIFVLIFGRGRLRKYKKRRRALQLYKAACMAVLGKPRAQSRADRRKLANYIRRGIHR
jgi:hypothetical protein